MGKKPKGTKLVKRGGGLGRDQKGSGGLNLKQGEMGGKRDLGGKIGRGGQWKTKGG